MTIDEVALTNINENYWDFLQCYDIAWTSKVANDWNMWAFKTKLMLYDRVFCTFLLPML